MQHAPSEWNTERQAVVKAQNPEVQETEGKEREYPNRRPEWQDSSEGSLANIMESNNDKENWQWW